jgi:hypothetical protein
MTSLSLYFDLKPYMQRFALSGRVTEPEGFVTSNLLVVFGMTA